MPNRIIKESVCTSDNIENLTPEEEIFFYRLLVTCDDYGRTDAREQILRAKCFPLRIDRISTDDIKEWLFRLAEEKLIILYEVDSKPYLQMATWDKHQQIRAKRSKFPAPDSPNSKMISNDIKSNQVQEHVPVIQSNPIQSESESNNNPTPEIEVVGVVDNIAKTIETEFGRPVSPSEVETLEFFVKCGIESAVVVAAIKESKLKDNPRVSYIEGILRNCLTANIKTLEAFETANQKYRQRNGSKKERGQPQKTTQPSKKYETLYKF